MNGPHTDDELRDLQCAFAAETGTDRSGEGCPGSEEMWDAVLGRLTPARTYELVDHTASCPACAEAWRLAHRLQRELGSQQAAKRSRRRPWTTLVAAAAAVVLTVIGFRSLVPGGGAPVPVFREADTATIRSLLPEDRLLPRENCLLSWSPGPDSTRYDLSVATGGLSVITSIKGLEQTAYQVPPEALADLPNGAKLLWQVEAIRPDGSRVTSQTFVSHLQ